jgi:hypothetical protein
MSSNNDEQLFQDACDVVLTIKDYTRDNSLTVGTYLTAEDVINFVELLTEKNNR